jgi:outer membrane protein assembly factor BamB
MTGRCCRTVRGPVRRALTLGLSLGMAVLMLACSSTDKPKPAALQAFEARIAGRQVWQARVQGLDAGLAVTVRQDTAFVAGQDGTVIALATDSGGERWRASAGAPLSAGVGSDGRIAAVVTRDNEVVTFDAGRPGWRKRLAVKVVTPPLVAGERVFVLAVDRSVHAFDALDGRPLWRLQRPGDALTLAQPGVLSPFGNTLLVGQGSRLTALDPLKGSVLWDLAMATPRGSNEVERLADLVGPAARLGDRVCARAFQSAVACADARTGALLWSRNAGGTHAVAGDADRVIGADASDRIAAWRSGGGELAWTNESLLHRGLSGALVAGPAVVFGDQEGQVHFLSVADGSPLLRLPTDSSAVVGTPVLAGTTVIVTTRAGGIFAFRPN